MSRIAEFSSDRERPRDVSVSVLRWPKWPLAIAALLLAIGAFTAGLVYQATDATSHLAAAHESVVHAKDALAAGDTAAAAQWVERARINAENAHRSAHSVSWSVAAAVPWVGSPLETERQMSDVMLGLTERVLGPAVALAKDVSPERLLTRDGEVRPGTLRDNAPRLDDIARDAAALDAQTKSIPEPAYLTAVGDARTALRREVADLAELLQMPPQAAELAPAMVRTDAPRTYLSGLQTTAGVRDSSSGRDRPTPRSANAQQTPSPSVYEVASEAVVS